MTSDAAILEADTVQIRERSNFFILPESTFCLRCESSRIHETPYFPQETGTRILGLVKSTNGSIASVPRAVPPVCAIRLRSVLRSIPFCLAAATSDRPHGYRSKTTSRLYLQRLACGSGASHSVGVAFLGIVDLGVTAVASLIPKWSTVTAIRTALCYDTGTLPSIISLSLFPFAKLRGGAT